MQRLPRVVLPVQVSVVNPKLNLLYYCSFLPILVYAFVTLFFQRKYSTTIFNNPSLLVGWASDAYELSGQEFRDNPVPAGICTLHGLHHRALACNETEDIQVLCDSTPLVDSANTNSDIASVSVSCPRLCNISQDSNEKGRSVCARMIGLLKSFGPYEVVATTSSLNYNLSSRRLHTAWAVHHQVLRARLNIEYRYQLADAPPSFFGLETRRHGTMLDCSTVLVDIHNNVRYVFEPVESISLPLFKLLELAGVQDTHQTYAGLQLDGYITCYTDDIDAGHEGLTWHDVQQVHAQLSRPLCEIRFVSVGKADMSYIPYEGPNAERGDSLRVQLGIRIVAHPGSGSHRVPDPATLALSIISFIALMYLPKYLVICVATRLLGPLSVMYRNLLIRRFDFKGSIVDVSRRLVANHQAIVSLQRADLVVKSSTQQILAKIFKQVSCIGSSEAERIVSYVAAARGCMRKDANERFPELEEFCDSMASDGVINLAQMGKLFDLQRHRSRLEQFFTPTEISTCIKRSDDPTTEFVDFALDEDTEELEFSRCLSGGSNQSLSERAPKPRLHRAKSGPVLPSAAHGWGPELSTLPLASRLRLLEEENGRLLNKNESAVSQMRSLRSELEELRSKNESLEDRLVEITLAQPSASHKAQLQTQQKRVEALEAMLLQQNRGMELLQQQVEKVLTPLINE